jgi:hypothetical protein
MECDLPAALKTIGRRDHCSSSPKIGISCEFPSNFHESRCSRFFRPLLYQLSYLGESLILLGNSRANRTPARAMV